MYNFSKFVMIYYENYTNNWKKNPPFACIYTTCIALFRESFAFIHES